MRAILIGVLAMVLASCVYQVPPVSPEVMPDKSSAIFYGRFTVGNDYNMGNKLALWLQNMDNHQSFYAYFNEKQPLYAFRVPPGHYRIVGLAGVDALHKLQGRKAFSSTDTNGKTQPLFQVTANSEVYIGDFTGVVTINFSSDQEWAIKSCKNNFAETTVEFREKYPHLAAVPATSMFELQTELH